MDFIWELFPEATIIHIKRDPRGVLFLFLQQEWMPQELRNTTNFQAIFTGGGCSLNLGSSSESRRYIEIKLENLCRYPHETMSTIANLPDISNDFDFRTLDPVAIDRWRTEIPQSNGNL